MKVRFLISLLLVSIFSGAQAPDSISMASMKGHVHVLASDSLRGRGNHHPAQALAARYIASEFERYGLRPFPLFAGYQQPFIQAPGRIKAIEPSKALYNDMQNVIGMLKGKSRPQELVIVSAHYDHVGI